MEARIRPMVHLRHVPMLHRVPMDVIDMPVEVGLITDEMFPESMLPQGALVPFSSARIHPFRSIEPGLATLRDHPLDDTPTVGEILISGRQCPESMHVVGQQHPTLDHKRMGRTKRSDRFPQGRVHIDIGEKGLAPIGVDGEEIGASRHMGATVIRHGGIIAAMNGAGTRPTLASSVLRTSTWRTCHTLDEPNVR